MEKLEHNDRLTVRASDHFGIDINDVEPKHVQFIKDQDFALNYGYQGTPILTYGIEENGVVAFTEASGDVLADQWDHRFGTNR